MKKIWSLYLCMVLIIIGTLITITGCANKNTGEEITTKEVTAAEFDVGNEKVEMENISLLSDKMDLLIPKTFSIMPDEIADVKYPNGNRPTLIYTNESGSVNVGLNYTENEATDSEIQSYADYLKSTFENLYPSAQWYDWGVKEINGKTVGFMELLVPAIDTEIYNLIWFTDLDGRLLMITFNCTKKEMNDWNPIAKSIMNSMQFKNKF